MDAVRPALGLVERNPLRARQQVRRAWTTPVLAVGLINLLFAAGLALHLAVLISPFDGPIKLWTVDGSDWTMCPSARGGGWLVRHELSGMGVSDDSGWNRMPVRWPSGFTARIEGGQAVLLDRGGRVAAREGNRVILGGAGTSDGAGRRYFFACGGVHVAERNQPGSGDRR